MATGASTTTVTRVARFLQGGEGGYRRLLKDRTTTAPVDASHASQRNDPHRHPEIGPFVRGVVRAAAANGPPIRDLQGPAVRPVPQPAHRRALSPRRRHSRVRPGRSGRRGNRGQQRLDEQGVCVDRLLPLDFGYCSLCLAVPEQGGFTSPGRTVAASGSPPRTRRRSRQLSRPASHRGGDRGLEGVGRGRAHPADGGRDLRPGLDREHAPHPRPDGPGHGGPFPGDPGRAAKPHDRETATRSTGSCCGHAASRRPGNTDTSCSISRPAAVESVKQLLPGCKSPTVVPLAEPGYVAVHAMVLEETFWDVVEGIRACGGTDILVTPVEKFLR